MGGLAMLNPLRKIYLDRDFRENDILPLESVDIKIAMSTTSYAYANLYRKMQFEREETPN